MDKYAIEKWGLQVWQILQRNGYRFLGFLPSGDGLVVYGHYPQGADQLKKTLYTCYAFYRGGIKFDLFRRHRRNIVYDILEHFQLDFLLCPAKERDMPCQGCPPIDIRVIET